LNLGWRGLDSFLCDEVAKEVNLVCGDGALLWLQVKTEFAKVVKEFREQLHVFLKGHRIEADIIQVYE
jgi:hypothetical protein